MTTQEICEMYGVDHLFELAGVILLMGKSEFSANMTAADALNAATQLMINRNLDLIANNLEPER